MGGRSWRAIAVAAVLVVGASGCWPQVGAGPENSYSNGFETELTIDNVATLTQAWSGDGGVDAVYGGQVLDALGAGDRTAGSGVLDVRSRDASSGAVHWSRRLVEPSEGFGNAGSSGEPPTVVGDEVWLGWHAQGPGDIPHVCDAGWARLDLDTGELLDRTAEPMPGGYGRWPERAVPFGDRVVTQLVVGEYTALGGTCFQMPETTFQVRDAATAAVVWRGPTGQVPPTTTQHTGPIVVGDQVLTTLASTLRAFAAGGCGALDCTPSWTLDLGAPAFTLSAAPGGPLLAVTSQPGTSVAELVTVDLATHAVAWRAPLPTHATTTRLAIANGRAYVAYGSQLSIYDLAGCGAATCTPLWTAALAAPTSLARPVVAGGVVYVGTTAGAVHAFDASGCGSVTCTPAATVSLSGTPTHLTNLIVSGGQLYVEAQTVFTGGSTTGVTVFAPS